jgi:hypothetical protein
VITSDHPKQKLLFFVAQGIDDKLRREAREFVNGLAELRDWLIGVSTFVDEFQEMPNAGSEGDEPIETLGGYIEIYSAWPPNLLPREIDLRHFNEVTTLVFAVRDFSRQHEREFEFELDGTYMGAIDRGQPDESLVQGLLGEWRRRLGE